MGTVVPIFCTQIKNTITKIKHQNDAVQKYINSRTKNTLNIFKMKYLNYLPVVMKSKDHLADGVDIGDKRIHMVIRIASEEADYWTNTDCVVFEDFGKWKKGDEVFVKYVEIREVVGAYSEGKNKRIIDVDDQEVLLVRPDLVYLTMRDGELIPQDGWCLIKRVLEKPKNSLLIIPDMYEEKYKENEWEIVAVGGPSPESERVYGKDALPPVGKIILGKDSCGIPLEAGLNKKLKEEYHLIRHNEILAYEV